VSVPLARVRHDDGGQAAVETALVLPFVVLVLLAVVQVGLVVRAQVLLTHAAREAARAAAVDPDPAAPVDAAHHATTLDAGRMTVTATGRGARGSEVTVQLDYDEPTDVPLVGPLLGDVALHAGATMRVE